MEMQDAITRKIRGLIYKEQANTLLAHLRTSFHRNERHYFGNISGNNFKIWKFSWGAQGYHPVINGKVTISEQGEPTFNLKPTLNPLGYLQTIVGIIVINTLALFMIPSDTNNVFKTLMVLGITLALIGMVYFIYRYELDIISNSLKRN